MGNGRVRSKPGQVLCGGRVLYRYIEGLEVGNGRVRGEPGQVLSGGCVFVQVY